jgi:hypothetical protein
LNATTLDDRGQGTKHASASTELHSITSDFCQVQEHESELYSKVFGLWGLFFNDKYLDYIALNGKMIDEWWIGKDLEGRGCNLIEMIPRYLLRVTGEYHENPTSV